ncbi:MAG TPA: 50S ribosomal protein L4 [Phycisphaerae bacterium]|nr:50S ribosomal protein L4 [Phycisphaerae bacterium]HNU44454.1 50S ribosomal protein L4 [Phycisphaerae bacterium]
MLAVPVVNPKGERTGEMQIDPAWLGGEVRPRLMHQAVVAYLDHQRLRAARTKGRGDVAGSTRKIYRQKGTGNARMGTIRTCVRRGGGRAFGKRVPGGPKDISKQMRRRARDGAILAKIQANAALIVDGWSCPEPKTRAFTGLLTALGVGGSCVLAVGEYDRNVYLSGRNVAGAEVCPVDDLNAYQVLRRRKLVFTRAAFERLVSRLAEKGVTAESA